MSKPEFGSKAWLADLQRAIASESGAKPIDERILGFVDSIDTRYHGNRNLEADERIPSAVFNRLIERLESVVAAAATPSLYSALRELLDETFGKTSLVEAVRTSLLDRLDRMLDGVPGDLSSRISRGELRLDARDAAGAAEDFAAVLAQDDQSWTAHYGLLRALLAGKRDTESLPLLDELLRRRSNDPFGLQERARLLLRHNYVVEALVDIERLTRATQDPESLLWAAQQLLFAGRAREAAAICRQLAPSPEMQLILGKALLDVDDIAAAIEALEEALRQAAGQESRQEVATAKMNALTQLGNAYARRGETLRALGRYAEAMAIVGTTYELRRAVVKTSWQAHRTGAEQPAPVPSSDDELAARWIEPNMTARFADGKPVEISSPALVLAPYLERLQWGDTVESLILPVGRRDNREAFVALFRMELPRLRRIEIEAEYFGFACLFRMVQATFYPRLEAMLLTRCDLDAPSLELLAEHTPTGLCELFVASAAGRPKIPRPSRLAGLLRRWILPRLETLTLSDCELGADEAMALADAQLPSLTMLDLAGNDLRGLDTARFLDSAMVKRLHGLHISDTGVEMELLTGLLDRSDRLALQWIRADRAWSEDELRTVMNHPGYRKLPEIDLGLRSVPDEMWLKLLD